jgi:hypothetical protein
MVAEIVGVDWFRNLFPFLGDVPNERLRGLPSDDVEMHVELGGDRFENRRHRVFFDKELDVIVLARPQIQSVSARRVLSKVAKTTP